MLIFAHICTLQLNFLVAQAVAIFLAYAYRKVGSNGKHSYEARLLGTLVPGVCLGIFCYGRDIFHLLVLAFLGYAASVMSDSRHVHKVALLVAFLYMSKIHMMRMLYDYGGYILDITGNLDLLKETDNRTFNVIRPPLRSNNDRRAKDNFSSLFYT